MQELRRYTKLRELAIPDAFVAVSPSLITQLVPRELNRLVQFIQIRKIQNPDVWHSLVCRLEELHRSMSLSTIIHAHRLLPSERLTKLVKTKTSPDTVKELERDDLIYLLGLKGVNIVPVAHILTTRMSSASLYDLATTMNRLSKCESKSSPSVERLVDTVATSVNRLLVTGSVLSTPRDLALLANGFADHGFKHSSVYQALTQKISEIGLCGFSPQSIALVLHGLAKSGHDDFRLFDEFGGFITSNITAFRGEPRATAMVLYAFGKCRVKNDALLQTLAELVKREMQSFDPHSLALTVYGFSKLRFGADTDLWRLFCDEVVYRGTIRRRSKKFKWSTVDLGMLAKGFSRASLSGEQKERVNHVLFQLIKKATTGSSDASAELLDGLSRLCGEKDGSFEFWISKTVPQMLQRCTPMEIYSIVSSVVNIDIKNRPLAESLLEAAGRVTSADLRAKLLFKLSKLDVFDESFVKTSCKIISAYLPSYSAQELIRILYAVSQFQYRDSVFVSRLTQALCHQFRSGGSSLIEDVDLSVLLTSTARLRVVDEVLYDLVMRALFERSANTEFSERMASNILFSLATALASGDFSDEYSWIPSVTSVLLNRLGGDKNVSVEGIRQLQIFDLVMQMKGIQISDPTVAQILSRIRNVDTFASNMPSVEQSSATHREVSKYLNLVGLSHSNEVTMGPFSFDIYVPETRNVIEIDGPHHFFRNSTLRTSSSVTKHKVLKHLGYRIEHVPFQEWSQCTSELKKLVYCSSLAERALMQERGEEACS